MTDRRDTGLPEALGALERSLEADWQELQQRGLAFDIGMFTEEDEE